MTPSVLMVSEKGMGVLAIRGDAIGGRVCRRWRVPIRIDSDFVLLTANCAKQTGSQKVVTVALAYLSETAIAPKMRPDLQP